LGLEIKKGIVEFSHQRFIFNSGAKKIYPGIFLTGVITTDCIFSFMNQAVNPGGHNR